MLTSVPAATSAEPISDQLRRFLRFPELKDRCGIHYSRMHIDRLEKAGNFPKRINLSPNSVAWDEPEIAAWQAARMAERDEADAPKAA